MGGDMNLTYNGTRIVDGWECVVFVSSSGILFVVRIKDAAIVEIDFPVPIGTSLFNLNVQGILMARITLYNIVIGPPNPSNFNPPPGVCLEIKNITENYSKINRPLENLFTNPVTEIKDLEKKTIFRHSRELQQPNPTLNQTFSANWIMNASITPAPFTPYTLAELWLLILHPLHYSSPWIQLPEIYLLI